MPPPGPVDITTGLLAYWKFDEVSGSTVGDSVGNDIGTLMNGPTWTTGHLGNGVNLDGISGYLNVNDNTVLNPAQITLAGWVNPTSIAVNGGMVFSKADRIQYWLRVEPSSINLRANVNGTTLFTKPYSFVNGRWYHFAVTYD